VDAPEADNPPHAANSYEAMRAKISILVGAESEDEGRNEPGPGAVRVG